MSMRITHVIFGFTTGGAELMLADIMAEQAEAGHEVSLVVINHHYIFCLEPLYISLSILAIHKYQKLRWCQPSDIIDWNIKLLHHKL